jgi:hypothetical protein
VVQQIGDDQWGMSLPEWFKNFRKQENMTLRTIINYHAYDDIWVPETLAGKTIEEVGDKYAGDLLGEDPKASFAAIVDKAVAAVEALTEADLDRKVHLSYGDWPVREYLTHIITFRGFRIFEISKLIGVDTRMPDALVQGMWEMLKPHAEEYRQMHVFGPEVKIGTDAPLQDRLLAMSGRDPSTG